MKDRLIDLLDTCERDCGVDFPMPKEIIANDLIANGVIVPPVKVGQTVYSISTECVTTYHVVAVTLLMTYSMKRMEFQIQNLRGAIIPLYFEEIGKTVFLTKEEAEAKMKGGAE